MGAHAFVTQRPVNAGDHAGARAGQGGPFDGNMKDRHPVGIVDRADDRNHGPVVEQQRPLVAALSSALRVKDRPIERNAARLRR